MSQQIIVSNHDFTHGQINEELFARTDLEIYQKAAAEITGMFVDPNGGLVTRPGTKLLLDVAGNLVNLKNMFVITVTVAGVLTTFAISRNGSLHLYPGKIYKLTLRDPAIDPGHDFTEITLLSGNDYTYISSYAIVNNELLIIDDTVVVGTPISEIAKLTFTATTYLKSDVVFKHPPVFDFLNNYSTATFTLDAVAIGTATLTCSAAIFTGAAVGGTFSGIGATTGTELGRARIIAFFSSTQVEVRIIAAFDSSFTSGVLGEFCIYAQNAFVDDDARVVSLFRDRLVYASTIKLPQTIWLSQIGDYFNFDMAIGQPADAMAITLSNPHDFSRITDIISSKALQVFTADSEYANSAWSSDNFGPGSSIIHQTNIGHLGRPAIIDNYTVFRSQTGGLFAFLPNDDAQTWKTLNISVMSSSMLQQKPTWSADKKGVSDRNYELPTLNFGYWWDNIIQDNGVGGDLFFVGSSLANDQNYQQLIVGGTDVILTSMREQKVTAFTSFGAIINSAISIDTFCYLEMCTIPRPEITEIVLPSYIGVTQVLRNKIPMDFQFDTSTTSIDMSDSDPKDNYAIADIFTDGQRTYSVLLNQTVVPAVLQYFFYGYASADDTTGIIPDTTDRGSPNVGIQFPIKVRTMPAHVATTTGDNLYLKKRIVFAYIDAYRSMMFKINNVPVNGWQFPLYLDQGTLPKTEIYKTLIPSSWKRVQQLIISTDVPLPVNIRGLSYQVTI